MATRHECESALRTLATRLDEIARTHPASRPPDRTVVCRIPDLGTTYSGVLRGGALLDIAERGVAPDPGHVDAQVTFTIHSDDLVALVGGTLPFAAAWSTGRVKINASLRDLLRARSLI